MLINTENAPSLSMLLPLTLPTLPCGAVERPVWRESSTSWSWSTYSLLLCSGVSLFCVRLHACQIRSRDSILTPQSGLKVCELHVQLHLDMSYSFSAIQSKFPPVVFYRYIRYYFIFFFFFKICPPVMFAMICASANHSCPCGSIAISLPVS